MDPELEEEIDGQCEAEEAFEEPQDRQEVEDYPAIIVEEVPGASLVEEQGYSAQVLCMMTRCAERFRGAGGGDRRGGR